MPKNQFTVRFSLGSEQGNLTGIAFAEIPQ